MRDSLNRKERAKLSRRSRIILIVLMVIISLLVAGLSYWFTRTALIQQDLGNYELSIASAVNSIKGNTQLADASVLLSTAQRISTGDRISRVAVFDLAPNQMWFSHGSWDLNRFESNLLSQIRPSDDVDSIVGDDFKRLISEPNMRNLLSIFSAPNESLTTLSWVRDTDRRRMGFIMTSRDYGDLNETAFLAAKLSFVTLLIASLLGFFLSFRLTQGSKRTIKKDQTVLNNQVSRLSEIIDENKGLQKNMKLANSRAVELNERFLRRVGADLHDGPAQEIGYAVMCLKKIADKQDSKELGQEFYAVKQALEESLKEIREISTGLVMPELEQMTLQEAVNKVVQRYQINTGTEVVETYVNLPENIELPIKICAYRFAQEGLNNAYKHGNAKKCRFTAQLVNDVLHLSLKDDGIGFRKSELSTDGGHLGLMGLKDRIESLGGKLSINSELGVGTAIKVSIQVDDTITK